MHIQEIFEKCPILSILQGITPSEVIPIAETLLEVGFNAIVIPMNDPHALACISVLNEGLKNQAIIGAGTVTQNDHIVQAIAAGAKLIILPHSDPLLISTAKELGGICIAGFSTPTEAFNALKAQADALKLFPCPAPAMLRGMKNILPEIPVITAGGINPASMVHYFHAGAIGFEVGSNLYQAGDKPSLVRENAKLFNDTLRNLF